MNGCVTCSPRSGCQKISRDVLYNIFENRRHHRLPNNASAGTITRRLRRVFRQSFSDQHFPRGGAWLMVGPTARVDCASRSSTSPIFAAAFATSIDLGPACGQKGHRRQKGRGRARLTWITSSKQAVTILAKHRKISALFTTPQVARSPGRKD